MPLGYSAGGLWYILIPWPLPTAPLLALGDARHRIPTCTHPCTSAAVSLQHLSVLWPYALGSACHPYPLTTRSSNTSQENHYTPLYFRRCFFAAPLRPWKAHVTCQPTNMPLRYLAGGPSYTQAFPSLPLYSISPYFGKRMSPTYITPQTLRRGLWNTLVPPSLPPDSASRCFGKRISPWANLHHASEILRRGTNTYLCSPAAFPAPLRVLRRVRPTLCLWDTLQDHRCTPLFLLRCLQHLSILRKSISTSARLVLLRYFAVQP